MKKIQILLDNGFITLQDVFDYVDSGAYLNSGAPEDDADQMARDDYNDKDQMEWSDDDYNQMAAENEAAEQLAHELNRTDYIDAHPEYVVASTSYKLAETMVFPSNAEGEITDLDDLACLALRYGSDNWEDPIAAIIQLNTDEYKYIHVKTLNGGNNIHNLFKRINTLETTVI
jgi:hypothetical protein